MTANRRMFTCKYKSPSGKVITYIYDATDWPSTNPNPKWCAVLMAARRVLGLKLREVAEVVGLNSYTISNAEHGRYRMAESSETKVVKFYLEEFSALGWQTSTESVSLDGLRLALSKAILGLAGESQGLAEVSSDPAAGSPRTATARPG